MQTGPHTLVCSVALKFVLQDGRVAIGTIASGTGVCTRAPIAAVALRAYNRREPATLKVVFVSAGPNLLLRTSDIGAAQSPPRTIIIERHRKNKEQKFWEIARGGLFFLV